MTKLLEVRKILKSSKPKFLRQDAHKIPRLEKKWKKPTGIHNKMRLKKKGHRRGPSVGYKSPKQVRGLTRTGFKPITISNIKNLENIDHKTEAGLISRTVGKRNKIKILERAKHLHITILNFKDIDLYIKNVKEKFEKKPKETKIEHKKEPEPEAKKEVKEEKTTEKQNETK